MDRFEVDGSTLACQTTGRGDPIIFVHGSAGSARQWKRLYEHFASSRRVFAFDLDGYGANPPWPPGRAFSWANDARAVSAAIDLLGAPVDIVAHSAGSLGTLLAARDQPEAIRSITVFEPVLFDILRTYDGDAFVPVGAYARRYRETFETAGDAAAMEGFVDFWNGPGSWPQLPEPVRRSMVAAAGRLHHEWGLVLTAPPLFTLDGFAAIRPPVLYFCGTDTIAPVRRIAEIVAPALSNCRLEPIPGAGHMGPFTHAAGVADAIAAHMNGARPA